MATIKYLAYAGLFTLVLVAYLFRQHWPLSLVSGPLTALLTPLIEIVSPYVEDPFQILTQVRDHALGYTISGTFIGGIAVAVTKWLGTKAKEKLQGEFQVVLDAKNEELENHSSEVSELQDERDKLKEKLSLMSQLADRQEKLLKLERSKAGNY